LLNEKALTLLGFAVRAGVCTFGTEACYKGVKSGKVWLIAADTGLSERSKKDIRNMCEFYETELCWVSPEGELARRTGRGALKIVGITKREMAEAMIKEAKGTEV